MCYATGEVMAESGIILKNMEIFFLLTQLEAVLWQIRQGISARHQGNVANVTIAPEQFRRMPRLSD